MVRYCTREIAATFQNKFSIQLQDEGEDEDSDHGFDNTVVPAKEISSWLDSVDDSIHIGADTFDTDFAMVVAESHQKQDTIQEFKDHSILIRETRAFEWFSNFLRREISLCRASPDTMKEIGQSLVNSLLPPSGFSASRAAKDFQVLLRVDWDLTSFLRQQEYEEEDHVALETAITLTESVSGPQATLCREYLESVWPTTGMLTLTTIQRFLRAEQSTTGKGMEEHNSIYSKWFG